MCIVVNQKIATIGSSHHVVDLKLVWQGSCIHHSTTYAGHQHILLLMKWYVNTTAGVASHTTTLL